MNIVVTPDAAMMDDPDNLSRLAVSASESIPLESIDTALRHSGWGRMDQGHALLDIEALRNRRHDLGYTDDQKFDAMIRYGKRKGWTSGDGKTVRAHIERTH